MTTYNAAAVSNTVIAHEKGITLQQGRALRDNPLAIAEGDSSVPAELLPTVLIGNATGLTGTSSITFSGLDLNPFKFLRLVFQGVSVTGSGNLRFGTAVLHSTMPDPFTQMYEVEVSSGLILGGGLNTGYSSASTSVTIDTSGGNFDAGSIRLYGMK